MQRAMPGIVNMKEVDPIDRMLEMYVDLADATNAETLAEIHANAASMSIYDWYEGDRFNYTEDKDYERLGRLHYRKRQLNVERSVAEDDRHHAQHELFQFIHGNLLDKLVTVEMLDGGDSIEALRYSTRQISAPELEVKGYKSRVTARICQPPLDGALLLILRPANKSRFISRRIDKYEVPIVDKTGTILADITAHD